MAVYKGDEGSMLADTAGGTPAAVEEVIDFNIEETVALVDTTSKGDSYLTHTPGRKSWSGTITCHADSTATIQAKLTVGASIDFEVYPEGNTTGRIKLTGTGTITGRPHVSPAGDESAKVTFPFVGSGTLTEANAA